MTQLTRVTVRLRHSARRLAVLKVMAIAVAVTGFAQQANVTPNYKDADIRQVIEAVGAVTGKNFVLDPRVKAQVTKSGAANG